MTKLVTVTDALNHVLCQIERDPDSSLLIVTLRRLAVICTNLAQGALPGVAGALAWLELFEREFRLERGRLRLAKALSVAKQIDQCKT